MRSGGQRTQTKQNTKRGECDYTDEAPAPLNQPKLIMNLWRALMSALDTEFRLSKKALQRILKLPRALQLQRRCLIVFNSPSS